MHWHARQQWLEQLVLAVRRRLHSGLDTHVLLRERVLFVCPLHPVREARLGALDELRRASRARCWEDDASHSSVVIRLGGCDHGAHSLQLIHLGHHRRATQPGGQGAAAIDADQLHESSTSNRLQPFTWIVGRHGSA
eukprot:scaffold116057_cov63-Phaeocystis_antarctica.AAC.4